MQKKTNEQENARNIDPCFFVLSTGRCGTKTLSILLSKSSEAMVWHEPRPTLFKFARQAYSGAFNTGRLFRVLTTCRLPLIDQACQMGVGYGETGNHVTFYAHALAKWLPNAKFIHLIRNPKGVIRSGMRRGWYKHMTKYDRTRIRPNEGTKADKLWKSWDQFERIAWLWKATNEYCREFFLQYPTRCIQVRAEDIFNNNPTVWPWLYDFIGLKMPDKSVIEQVLSQKINKQTTKSFPPPEEWPTELMGKMYKIAWTEMLNCGYDY